MPGNRWVYTVDFTPSLLKMLFLCGLRLASPSLKETTWRYLMVPVSPREMAVLRRVTREPPWLRRAGGLVIRTGSVCEQRTRQSRPLTCFGGCSLNR